MLSKQDLDRELAQSFQIVHTKMLLSSGFLHMNRRMRLDEVRRTSCIVFGAARSGEAAARLLKRHACPVIILDEKAEGQASAQKAALAEHGIESFWGTPADTRLLDGRDALILSPGIPPTNAFVAEAARRGLRIISEVELAHAFMNPAARLIAVTGTNGKTTTTAWTAHLLRAAGLNAVPCGNIGEAWSNSVDTAGNRSSSTVFVLEVSSFQLEQIEDFRPHVAVLTNLAPDHMDRYSAYGDYVAAKRRMLENLTAEDAFIWNADNADSRDFGTGSPAREFRFSTRNLQDGDGAFRQTDGMLIVRDGARVLDLIRASELPLPGLHNIENALCAALAAHLCGAPVKALGEGLRDFPGVEHRIELCGERGGVQFYNDSKATNVDSLEKALRSFTQPIVLIAGGRDKNSDYSVVDDLVRTRVARLISLGEAAPLVERAWGGYVPFERASSMADAVQRAARIAQPGQVVLLSPACASYDMYNNFEERGHDFKQEVQKTIKGGP